MTNIVALNIYFQPTIKSIQKTLLAYFRREFKDMRSLVFWYTLRRVPAGYSIRQLCSPTTELCETVRVFIHCKCDWTDTGAKQGLSQLTVELCRENIGKLPD